MFLDPLWLQRHAGASEVRRRSQNYVAKTTSRPERSLQRRMAVAGAVGLALAQQIARDHQTHDLVGAFVDLGDLGIAHVTLHGIFPGVTVTA